MRLSENMKAFTGNVIAAILSRVEEIQRDPRLYLKKIEDLLEFYRTVTLNGKKVQTETDDRVCQIDKDSCQTAAKVNYLFEKWRPR